MVNVFITPRFEGPDTGEGGIRRVVEAQRKYLPDYGVNIVTNVDDADVVAAHAVEWPRTTKPVVSHNHGLYWAEYEWAQWALNANRAVIDSLHRADAVTAVSQWTAKAIERNTMISPTVVYHGIDAQEWTPNAKGAHKGYVLWNKTRVDQICDPTSMQSLATLCPDVQFVTTYGSPEKNVEVTGKVPYEDAKQYVTDAAVYLCTARETFGIGTLEAMAAGVPVLGWAWGGQLEIIDHKVNGWLSRPGDFADLEKGLRYCLEHRVTMGKAARKKVLAQFTWQKAIKEYADLYVKVLDAEKARDGIRVSVVIPCYNLGTLIEDTVRSVAQQPALTSGEVEIVIVDDASTDNSGTVCDGLADRFTGITVIHNATNQYLAGALNTGIAAAKGKYIIPIDADNMLGDGCLPILADALDNNNSLDIVYGAMQVIEESGKEWVSTWPQDFNFGQQLGHHNQIPSTAMYRKKMWERVGGYRRRCRTAEDADFWCRVTSYGARPKKVTDMVTLKYRDRHDSMSHTVADWPWEKWYPWHRDPKMSPPISPFSGPIWTYEPPRISVIIPVGPGHTHLVVDAVDSLVSQDFRHWECIVINDSGTPIPWIHPFVTVLDTGGNRGAAFTRNMGFEAARAKLVLPLDADDYLQPNALSAFWETWQKVGGYIYSDWIVQETGEIKETEDYDCAAIKYRLPHAVTALYTKEMWKAVGGFDDKLDAWEDWDFIIALAAKGYCGARLPLPLVQYRINSGTRREELYARRDVLIENIKVKWQKYYAGDEPMPCGGCGGQARVQSAQEVMAASGPATPSNNGGDNLVLLEYVGKVSGPITFRGQKTGTQYRFGLDVSHKLKYVHKDDLDGFEGRTDFVRGKPPVELLQAAGR